MKLSAVATRVLHSQALTHVLPRGSHFVTSSLSSPSSSPLPAICHHPLFSEPSSPHSDGVLSVKQDALWSHQLFHGVCSGSTNDCPRLHFLPFTDLDSSPYSIASAIINIMRRLVVYPNRRRFLCLLNIFEACACARGNRHYVGVCGQCYCNGGSGMSQSVVVSL